MKEHEVTCITKSIPQGGHQHITHIGNLVLKWRLTKDDAVRRIEKRPQEEAFYTLDKTTNKKVFIAVVREVGKAPYLRTHADGKPNDNLLAQPDCTDACEVIA